MSNGQAPPETAHGVDSEVLRLGPGVIRFTFLVNDGRREFTLYEMTMGRVEEFIKKVIAAYEALQEKINIDRVGLADEDLVATLATFSVPIYAEVTKLWNWIFSYRNPEHKNVTPAWLRDNISIRQLGSVANEIVEQNRAGGLIKLMKGRMATAVRDTLGID